jgi:hypothetical protein
VVVQEPPILFLISSGPNLMGENKIGNSDIISPFLFYLTRRFDVSMLSILARFSPKIMRLISSVTGA